MNRDQKLLYIANGLFLGIILLVLFVPNAALVKMLLPLLLTPAAVVISFTIRKRSLLSIRKNQIIGLMLVIVSVYLMVYYLTGLHFGFYQRSVVFSGKTFWNLIFPLLVSIVASEIIRRVFLAQKDKWMMLISFVSFVLLDILLQIEPDTVHTFYGFVNTVSMVLFPAVTSNVLFHYVSAKYGAVPNILYRGILYTYMYVIPVAPATPNAIVAFAKVVVPLTILVFLLVLYERKTYASSRRRLGRIGAALYSVGVVVMAAFIMLISCRFHYGVIVVGSPSMTGAYNKGDGVFYEEYDGQLILKGDVILFRRDNRTIIHRVVDILNIDGELRYYTKGDANDSMDAGYVTKSQIVGIAKRRLAYIGCPTLWLREFFQGSPIQSES